MQSNFLLFFYILFLVLYIPTALFGSLLKPPPSPKISTKLTPKQILKLISKNKQEALKAKKAFEKDYIQADSCPKEKWLEMIKAFALSLDTTLVSEFGEKIKEVNPSLSKEVALLIATALKERR